MIFGLITEGVTDQVVLETIIGRYFNDPDIDVRSVQPNMDATDAEFHFGGWGRVFDYCKSNRLLADLETYDYVVIQLDTDACEEYAISKREKNKDLTEEHIVEKVRQKIIDTIGNELYKSFASKIIFAICYESLECWFLPLYFTNNKRGKSKNCCDTLNQELRKENFTIDCESKVATYHSRICRKIRNRTHVEDMAAHQKSLSIFLDQLPSVS